MKSDSDRVDVDYFCGSRGRENLKNEAIRGGGVAVASRGLNTIIQIGGTVILARLLTPEDFGLVAMVIAFTAIFTLFQDVGLTDATIQAAEITHKQVSTLFWINLAISFSITVLLIALSPLISWFYKTPQLSKIMMMSSISYIFWGLTFQHAALLKRNMLFFRVSIIGVLAQFVGIGVSIILALTGFKYWAIVLRDITVSIITCILTWTFCRWRPGLPSKKSGASPLVKFGLRSAGYYMVNYLARNLDKILLGKRYGSVQLGFYSKAYYLATTPAGQLSDSLFHVSVSTLSKIRNDTYKYQRYYLSVLSAISFVGMPLAVLLVILSRELVLLLLGPQWNAASEIFSILGLASGMYVLYFTNSWLHVSLGRSDRLLKWGIFSSTILAVAFIIGMFFGPKGIAWGYSLAIIMLTFPGILYAGRPIGLRLDKVLSSIWKNLLAAVLSGFIINFIKNRNLFKAPLFLSVLITISTYGGTYLIINILFKGGMSSLKEMYSIIKIFLSKRT